MFFFNGRAACGEMVYVAARQGPSEFATAGVAGYVEDCEDARTPHGGDRRRLSKGCYVPPGPHAAFNIPPAIREMISSRMKVITIIKKAMAAAMPNSMPRCQFR